MSSSYGNKIYFPDEQLLHITLMTRQIHFYLFFFSQKQKVVTFFLDLFLSSKKKKIAFLDCFDKNLSFLKVYRLKITIERIIEFTGRISQHFHKVNGIIFFAHIHLG